jgi:hypothetical protein
VYQKASVILLYHCHKAAVHFLYTRVIQRKACFIGVAPQAFSCAFRFRFFQHPEGQQRLIFIV